MRTPRALLFAIAIASLSPALAAQKRARPRTPLPSALTKLRGGGLPLALNLPALSSHALGIPALAGIGFGVILPLTLYRQAYAFSVGYGFSVAAMGVALLLHFQPPLASLGALQTGCVAVYGLRLGLHLLVREFTVPEKAAALKTMDSSPRMKRVPFAASVSLLYAMMTSPALFALQAVASTHSSPLAVAGVAMQWSGCALEAVSDTHKLLAKRRAARTSSKVWQGPSGGCYAFSRHPNYAGELLFWAGTFLGGAPTFGWRPAPWLAGGLGLAAITSIMLGATNRLEAKQRDKYGGQPEYEAWVAKTAALFVGSF